ncbi:hypothetical protein [Pseudomonas sp. PDM13]|nr:hypothetical protein [Pseudomonas sp. PDM13]MCU9946906.1 hypothetical protein [Pseudomonas sp. PDM13]
MRVLKTLLLPVLLILSLIGVDGFRAPLPVQPLSPPAVLFPGTGR